MKMYVGNLPFTTDDQQLRTLFEAHGTVDSAKVITDRETGRSRGFGFVEMVDESAGQSAIQTLDNRMLDGRNIKVNVARSRQSNGGGGGRW